MSELDLQRKRINEINTELSALLAERMEVAGKIADYKRENGLPVFDRARERDVIATARDAAPENIASMIAGSFDAIMAMSCLYQYIKHAKDENRVIDYAPAPFPKNARVGCQGIAGSYASIAAKRLFPDISPVFYPEWSDVFAAVEAGEIDYGVLPIENSTAGSVNAVYSLLMNNSLYINAATTIAIDHCLLVPRGTADADIVHVHSHQQALEQCREYLDRLGAERILSPNTAIAAKEVSALGAGEAAIAPRECAEIYSLDVKDEHIQSAKANRTRFIAVAKAPASAVPSTIGGEDKISLRFSLEHSEGSLSRVLSYFAALGQSLTKLESRPSRDNRDQYDFYLDFSGNADSEEVMNFLCAVPDFLTNFRFLGRYREI